MNYWLVKSEPDVFSFDDLLSAPAQTSMWEGVRNYQARNYMRDAMCKGDSVLFYHSNAKPTGVVGIAEVASEAYPDPTQFDPESLYYDAKATLETPRWLLVDIRAKRKLPRLISLAELKTQSQLQTMHLLQKGNRLSVMPVTRDAFEHIVALSSESA